jgi:hypothetical protein
VSGNFPNRFNIFNVTNLIGVVSHQIIMIFFGNVLTGLYTCNEIHNEKENRSTFGKQNHLIFCAAVKCGILSNALTLILPSDIFDESDCKKWTLD